MMSPVAFTDSVYPPFLTDPESNRLAPESSVMVWASVSVMGSARVLKPAVLVTPFERFTALPVTWKPFSWNSMEENDNDVLTGRSLLEVFTLASEPKTMVSPAVGLEPPIQFAPLDQ